ncbi:LytR family transcriptional regulator [Ornithinibacillus sp. L9]|uniref:LytR family transcriptional regulator n=1 Tax=Ornithinibacillus caprae TaxID=2678566 RepID=A0A6N8FJ52_9BACI|nr:LCP family protein [Ornithinibacillus caprae]MUK87358.1 LytR family transcriptional regulator [Ornithinibacillus caprae]
MSKNESSPSRLVKQTKKRKLRKRIYFILIPFLIAFIGFGYFISLYIKAESTVSDSYEDDGREKSDLRDSKVDPTEDNVSILIIGVDENNHRDNAGDSRSDALLLATLNKKDKSVKLLSIPRDSKVFIPEVGYEDKITHAHAFGGPQATIETVENLLDIPVDYFVKLNFHAFVDVVNAIDGITVDVPYEFWESDSNDKKNSIHLLPGEQLLDGEEALALARTRKLDNDIERGKRQMDIIKSVAKKATSVSSVMKLDDVIEAVGDNMTTNLSFNEMKSFLSYATSGSNLDIDSMTLEGHDHQPANVYYWQLDELALNETKQTLQTHLEIIEDKDANTGSVNALQNESESDSY